MISDKSQNQFQKNKSAKEDIALRENFTNKRLAKQADFDLDMINAISAVDLALISSCQPCMLLCINRS